MPTRPRTSTAYSLQSVRNALQIVRMLQDREELSVSEVAQELGVGMSTAHRLLSTLKLESFVRQSLSSKKYLLGPVMTASAPARIIEDYIAAAREPMRDLADGAGETSHLIVRDGRVIRFLHVAESRRLVRLTSRVGKTLPVHAASGGKVLLAHLSSLELNQLFPSERLPAITAGTIGSRAALIEQLAQIAVDGYAINEAESEDDVFAVAAPIMDPNGIPIASISLAGPDYRFTEKSMHLATQRSASPLQLLLETAATIAAALNK